jgi:hypothetical protein
VAGAEHGADRTNREDHGAVRLLTSWWLVEFVPSQRLTTNHH